MRGFVKFVGVTAFAMAGAFVATTVFADENVRVKVREAADAVVTAMREVKDVVADGVSAARQDSHMTPVERNQAWVDAQWDELGI